MRISEIIFIIIAILIILTRKDYWRMAKTLIVLYAGSTFWQVIEVIRYGEVQNRGLDNIIAVMLIPIVYRSMGETKED